MALSTSDAAHLLRRVGFGALPAEISTLAGLSREAAVDIVTDPARAGVRPYPDALLRSPNEYSAWTESLYWWMESMISAPWPLQEKLTLFWHGHFASSQDKVGVMAAMLQQNQVFRSLGLASFRDLAQAVSIGPAMISYLDNASNVKTSPQENFARELMELHTLGVGGYTEEDVVGMARAWTGHGLADPRTYAFFADRHDFDPKTIFGITRAWDGPETIDEIVLGSRQATCARFVARKLYRFFVHPNPSDAVADQLAAAFIASGMNVRALVRAILLHDDFWAPATRYALVKSPIEFVVEFMRRTGLPTAAVGFHFTMQATGQLPFYPPGVAGWGENEPWLSVQSAWGRSGFLGYARGATGARGWWADIKDQPSSTAVQRILDDLGIIEPSPGTRYYLEDWFRTAVVGAPANVHMDAVLVGGMVPEFQLK